MRARCRSCGHKPCLRCLRLAWETFVPESGPNFVCCQCQSSQSIRGSNGKRNGRVENGDLFLAQPRDDKRFVYPAEVNNELSFEWPKATEKQMLKIVRKI